jgi:hypothetical protein
MSAPVDYAKVAACVRRYQLMYSPGGECLEDAAKLCEAWPLAIALLDAVDDLPSPRRNDSASFTTEVHESDLCDCHDAAKRLRAELEK